MNMVTLHVNEYNRNISRAFDMGAAVGRGVRVKSPLRTLLIELQQIPPEKGEGNTMSSKRAIVLDKAWKTPGGKVVSEDALIIFNPMHITIMKVGGTDGEKIEISTDDLDKIIEAREAQVKEKGGSPTW